MDTFHIIFSYWLRDLGNGSYDVTFDIKFVLNHPDGTSDLIHEHQYTKTTDAEFLNETISREEYVWTHPGIANYGQVQPPQ